MSSTRNTLIDWPLWRKILFRFFFIFFLLQLSPWTWLNVIPGVDYITRYPEDLLDLGVNWVNAHVFHVRPVLVYPNGSGDTSYGWAMLWFSILIASIGCIIWSFLDGRRKDYIFLNYWLCLFLRYFIAINCFTYGLQKVFVLQMPFPNLHQLATPLGDFLPMRLSWMFLGYSKTNQIFSGAMELLAGFLLLYRHTARLGVLVSAGVFINVMMRNLSYDIPVKLYSALLALCSLFLLGSEGTQFFHFFFLDKPLQKNTIYQFTNNQRGVRIARMVLKTVFILVFVCYATYQTYGYYKQSIKLPDKQPFANGIYDVTSFSLKRNGKAVALPDSLIWKDVIFENGTASAKTGDTIFRQRYKRGYFFFKTDFSRKQIAVRKLQDDSTLITKLNYALLDSGRIKLWGMFKKDSLFVNLKKTGRPFQLTERQFHWLSEHNR